MLEVNHSERRQRYTNRMIPAVRGHRMRIDTAVVADAAAAVNRRVRIQQLPASNPDAARRAGNSLAAPA